MKTLSIIIPAYNEQKSILALLHEVKKVNLKQLGVRKEIIVVNDGSTDQTADLLAQEDDIKVITHRQNQGKGAAIRTGIQNAQGDILLIQDADLEYDPAEYPQLINPILQNKAKVVYGSRYISGIQQQRNRDFLKKQHEKAYTLFYVGGRIITFITNLLYGANITDEATCYKVFTSDVIKQIKLDCKKFEFCPEITAKIRKQGYNILEVPISYNPRSVEDGKKIKFRDGFQAILTLVKYHFND